MIGSTKVRPIQQKTLFPHELALDHAHCLRIKGPYYMSCVVLQAFNSYLGLEYKNLQNLVKRCIIWLRQNAILVLNQSEFGFSQSIIIRFKLE